jgi:hypothetical protein
VTLSLAALQPGDNNFDIFLKKTAGGAPVTDAERVALRLTHPEMEMAESEAIATSRGDGHYVASGPYLSMSGRWDLRVLVRRANTPDIDQTFAFPIGATANLAAPEGATDRTATPAPELEPWDRLRRDRHGLILAFFGVQLFRRGSGFARR